MKLSPKIKLGCKSCNKNANNFDFNIDSGGFRFNIKQNNKVTSITNFKKEVKNNKVKSLF